MRKPSMKTKRHHTTTYILLRDFLRTSLHNWKQLISIVAISFLALCLFCGLTSNAYLVKDRVDKVYANSGYPDLFVTTASLSDEDTEALEGIDGIDRMETRIYAPVYIGSQVIYLEGAESESSLSVPYMSSGKRGVVVTEGLAADRDLSIGSDLTLYFDSLLLDSFIGDYRSLFDLAVRRVGSNILRETRVPITFRVTGIGYHPEGMGNANFSPSVVYCDIPNLIDSIYSSLTANYHLGVLNFFFYLADTDLFSLVNGMVSQMRNQALIDSSNPEVVKQEVDSFFETSSSVLISNQLGTETSGYREIQREVTQSMNMTCVFPIIFFLVSVLVILTTISQLIIRQRSQIGTLKAIGVPGWRIYLHYSCYGAITTGLGTLLGFVIGPLFIPNVLGIKYSILWSLPSASVRFFHPLSILISILMILIAALCSFLVSWSVVKERPVETLRPKKQRRRVKPSNPKSLFARIPLELKMAFRNMRMNLGKTIMVMIGMLGCCGLLVCGFGIMNTINYGIDLDFNKTMVFDIMAVPGSPSPAVQNRILQVPGVERIETLGVLNATATGETSEDLTLFLVEDDSEMFNVPTGIDGGVSMSKVTADNLGLEIGDTFALYISRQNYELELTYTYDTSTINGVVALASSFEELSSSISTYLIKLRNSTGTSMEDVRGTMQEMEELVSVISHESLFSYADNLVQMVSLMTTVLETFAILLSLVVVYNLTSLNITSRHREIATMKVLGFRYKEITKTLTYEMMMDVILGSLLGLAVGFPFMYVVMATNTTSLFNFLYHINWWSYVLSLAIAGVSALVTSLLLCLKTKTINMSESLKSVEE